MASRVDLELAGLHSDPRTAGGRNQQVAVEHNLETRIHHQLAEMRLTEMR
ncbi:MAG: hypothetical protein IT430_14120 [Phycisphaerales bacterium]|nr:hypothetical protein [Phycisphaerales bacterium]